MTTVPRRKPRRPVWMWTGTECDRGKAAENCQMIFDDFFFLNLIKSENLYEMF